MQSGSVTHTITEQRDDLGRSTGYTYAKDGAVQQTVRIGYATDGRISPAPPPPPFRLRVTLCSLATPRQAKNICEIYGQTGYIRTLYTYTPYGSVTEEGDISQPIQWSSEFNDTEMGLVYYNHRHYNSSDGRWIGRDIVQELSALNLYSNVSPLFSSDFLGAWADGSSNPKHYELYGKGHSDFPGQTPNGPFDYTLEDKGDTSPFNPTATWRHFRPLVDSERELAKYTKTCNKKEYESRAHQMQDYFSHYGQGFRADKYNHTIIEVLIRFLGLFEEDTVYNSFPKMETLTILGNYPLGHALASVKGRRPGMPMPDNSLHYEAAYEQARERTQKWLNQWNICCCQENGRWIPKKNIQTGKSECENFTGFLDSATVKALPPNLSTVYTPSKINTPVQLKGVVWEDTH